MKITLKLGINGTNSFFFKGELTDVSEANAKLDAEGVQRLLTTLSGNGYKIREIEIDKKTIKFD